MAEEEDSKVNSPDPPPPPPPPPPPFLEVKCKSTGKTRRFAAGTKAGFAISLMNRKLGVGDPPCLYVEAVKDGEEPVSFGPDAILVNYGTGWKLQTFNDSDIAGHARSGRVQPIPKPMSNGATSDDPYPAKTVTNPTIDCVYIAKILLAFIFIFVLGAIFTLALEGLPKFLGYVNSLM